MPTVLIAYNYVNYSDKSRFDAQTVALDVLSKLPENFVVANYAYKEEQKPEQLKEYPFIQHQTVLSRNSQKEIGNSRNLPYIKEILMQAYRNHFDFFGYINSDILFSPACWGLFGDSDAYIFSRRDIGNTSVHRFLRNDFRVIYGGNEHVGADGFFFRRNWWAKNHKRFPDDLILGETEWDTVYRYIIKKHCKNYLEKRCLHHVYHDSLWNTKTQGAKNNIRIFNEVCGESVY